MSPVGCRFLAPLGTPSVEPYWITTRDGQGLNCCWSATTVRSGLRCSQRSSSSLTMPGRRGNSMPWVWLQVPCLTSEQGPVGTPFTSKIQGTL